MTAQMIGARRPRSRLQQSFRLSSRNVGSRAARGVLMTGYSSLLRAGLTIGSTAVLARLLTPEEFGLSAMAALVYEMIALLGSFGFTAALVRSPRLTRIDFDTAFWLSIGVGVGLGGLLLAASPAAGLVFGDERVIPLIAALAILPLFEFGGVVQSATISRLMLFRLDLVVQVAHIGVRSIAAIVFAWLGYGVWSLILGGIVGRAAGVLMYWIAVPYLPRFRVSRRFLEGGLKFSARMFVNNLIWYMQMNIDYFIVGRVLGPTQLGFYQAGYRLADEVKNRVIGPLQKVLFPAFATLRAEPGRLADAYLRSVRILAVFLAPIGLGMAALASDIVLILYGKGWEQAATVMSLLGPFVVFRSALSTPTSSLLLSNDMLDLSIRLQWYALLLSGGLALAGIPWGIVGVASGIGASAILWMPVVMLSLRARLGIGAGALLLALGLPFTAGTLMFIVVRVAGDLIGPEDVHWSVRLVVLVLLGAAVYTGMLWTIARTHVMQLRAALGAMRR